MKIGGALDALEQGHRVTCEDGAWLFLVGGMTFRPIDLPHPFDFGMIAKVIQVDRPGLVVQHPRIDKRERDGSITVGWTPTTSEFFADYRVVE